MSDTPKIDKIEINNAYKYSNNATLIHNNYTYESIDNGDIVNSSKFYPYDLNKSFICSSLYLDSDFTGTAFKGGTIVNSNPSTYHSSSSNDDFQDVTAIGKEIMHALTYNSYYGGTDNISHKENAVLIHTMQDKEPAYYDISLSNLGFQYDFYDKSVNYDTINNIANLPRKHIRFNSGYDTGFDANIIYYGYNSRTPFEPLTITQNGQSILIYNDTPYLPDYHKYITNYIPLSTLAPNLSYLDIDDALIPNNIGVAYSVCNRLFGNGYQVHNTINKDFNSYLNYYCSTANSHINSYGSKYNIFNYKLLPTYTGNVLGRIKRTLNTANYTTGFDLAYFLNAYSNFKSSGMTIRPAILDDPYSGVVGTTDLPTIAVSSINDMVLYEGSYYAPVDVDKCEQILNTFKNIYNHAINEVILIPASQCTIPPYSNYPSDTFYTKENLTLNRNVTITEENYL